MSLFFVFSFSVSKQRKCTKGKLVWRDKSRLIDFTESSWSCWSPIHSRRSWDVLTPTLASSFPIKSKISYQRLTVESGSARGFFLLKDRLSCHEMIDCWYKRLNFLNIHTFDSEDDGVYIRVPPDTRRFTGRQRSNSFLHFIREI